MPSLCEDRRGNVAMMMGLLVVPLLGLVGLAVDFGTAISVRAQLDLAADAAALLATTNASNAYLAGAADPIGPAQTAATQRFNGQAGTLPGVSIASVTVAVHQSGTVFSADITYQGAMQTSLAYVFGFPSFAVGGKSSASLAISPYVDIAVLMDVSSSMAIASTQVDIAKMQVLTAAYIPPPGGSPGVNRGEACAFACHWSATSFDYYALAHQNNVRLRIDDLRSAVGNMVNTITSLNTHSAYRVGLYTEAQTFSQIFAMSSSTGDASTAISQIAPHVNDCQANCPDTFLNEGVGSMTGVLGTSGDGGSQATSQKFLFIVSDGLEDANLGGRKITVLPQANCNAIKAKGVTIMTLYTPYLPLPTNAFYNANVAPIQTQIGPALQACASSPALFYQATDTNDVNAQLQRMLANVLQSSGHFTK